MIGNLGDKGIITIPTVLMFNAGKINVENVIKRYCVFFDKLYFYDNTPNSFIGGVSGSPYAKNKLQAILINLGGNEDFILSQEFNEIVKEDEDINEFLHKNKSSIEEEFMKMSDDNKRKFKTILKDTVMNYETPKENDFNFVLNFYGNFLLSDYNLYHVLSKNLPDYSGLISPILKNIILGVFSQNINTGEEIIDEVAKINFIDFGQLTWKEIYELRNSGFAKSFRNKIREWLIEFEDESDIDLLNKKINKYITEANFSFINNNRKNIPLISITALLGNTPVKYFNPVSVLSGLKDIREGVKLKNDFGWLYFVEEMHRKSK